MNSSPWRLEEVDGGDEQYLVESVLRYATPLPMNRTPISTVGGPFPPFSGTPDPSRWTGSRFDRAGRTEGCFLRFAVRQTPPDEQDPV